MFFFHSSDGAQDFSGGQLLYSKQLYEFGLNVCVCVFFGTCVRKQNMN